MRFPLLLLAFCVASLSLSLERLARGSVVLGLRQTLSFLWWPQFHLEGGINHSLSPSLSDLAWPRSPSCSTSLPLRLWIPSAAGATADAAKPRPWGIWEREYVEGSWRNEGCKALP